jgi:hypothetical protein
MAHPLEEHYRSVSAQLLTLETIFDDSERGKNYRSHFKEELEENELEVALHAICNFLLEQECPLEDAEALARIDALHKQMQIHDDCVEKLRRIRNDSKPPSS